MNFQCGIDLGNCNCCLAIWKDNGVEVLPDEQDRRTIPSYVSFTDRGVVVGYAAKARAHVDPKNTIHSVLLLLGKKRSEVLHHTQNLPYEVIETQGGRLKIRVSFNSRRETYFPEEIIALILSHLKCIASKHLGQPVTSAVISYPHSFNLLQVQLLQTAASAAGLQSVKFSSSTALGALAFGYQNKLHRLNEQSTFFLLVFDMGGGSTGASLVSCNGRSYSVVNAGSTCSCGGIDLTNALVGYFTQELRKRSIDLPRDCKMFSKFHSECERVKRALSDALTAHLQLDMFLLERNDSITLTRHVFEELCADIFLSAMEVINDALVGYHSGSGKMHMQCILVGGSTRIPKLKKMVEDRFSSQAMKAVNPDEAVAIGAAIQAANLCYSYTAEEQMVITHTNPAVPFTLCEVVANSIGLETENDKVECVISKGVEYPVERNTQFHHSSPGTLLPIDIKVYEGENLDTRGNSLIGRTHIYSSSAVEIQIKLLYTHLNTLSIEVKDLHESLVLLRKDDVCDRLHSSEEVDFMKLRISMFEEQQQKRYKYMEARNQLEHYALTIEREVNSGALLGKEAEKLLTSCRNVFEELEKVGSDEEANTEQIKVLHIKLQHMYEEQTRKATVLPDQVTSHSHTRSSL